MSQHEVEAPRLSVEWMLAQVLGLSRVRVYLAHDRPLTEEERHRLREMVARRAKHEPLAYILGEWDFCGHKLRVGPEVLIPRPETEQLVQLAVDLLPQGGRGLDLGTGSGAIAIALALARPDLSLGASDISAAALTLARQNVVDHQLEQRISLREGSFAQPWLADGPFDFLLSNPPYVDPQQPELLAGDVADYEPAQALFTAPGDPASAYRQILMDLPALLKPGAWILMETGVGADQAALQAMQACPQLCQVSLRQDLAGHPRYLLAQMAG